MKQTESIMMKQLIVILTFFLTSVMAPPVFGELPVERPNITAPPDTVEWERPRFDERADERETLVASGIIGEGITDEAVIDAMRHVPRHKFVPSGQQRQAYLNNPLPIGYGQTISQPYIVAYMAEMLEIEPGDKVLEIGTGSGYHAAVLSELTPHVFSIEIVEPLGRQATELYEELGYHTIQTKLADGYHGWEEHAPFDKIIVTAASGHIPPPLIDQLKPGGTMAIPVGSPYQTQTLMKVTKTEEGDIRTERLLPVQFVPMTGEAEEQN
ncbi:MAG: protein-L-isoaspartate(D-aspartate) O-methyltransferase [Balneolaceae bacterium]|nr:protein-L-isoaspartate(D-aspartate) O-methyltransferase [Balneolaceae bacterium]